MSADDRFEDPREEELHAVLRGQPLLRAPSSLEQRVRAEIARRQARPWWQRSFAEWPVLPRAAFVTLSGCAAVICVAVGMAAINGPGGEIVTAFIQKTSLVSEAVQSSIAWTARLLGEVSSGWFYLAGGVLAAAGAGLLGIGATAYRLLWQDSQSAD